MSQEHEQLRQEMQKFSDKELKPLWTLFLVTGEVVVDSDGKIVDPERCRRPASAAAALDAALYEKQLRRNYDQSAIATYGMNRAK